MRGRVAVPDPHGFPLICVDGSKSGSDLKLREMGGYWLSNGWIIRETGG